MCCYTHEMPTSETGGEEAEDDRFRCRCPARMYDEYYAECIRRATQEDGLCDICSDRSRPGLNADGIAKMTNELGPMGKVVVAIHYAEDTYGDKWVKELPGNELPGKWRPTYEVLGIDVEEWIRTFPDSLRRWADNEF